MGLTGLAGVADAAVVGGADTLCRLTLHGFGSLELLAKGPTRPCAEDRDGISIEAPGGTREYDILSVRYLD